MPWTCTDPMLERAKLVSLYHDGLYSAAELAERFAVSRKTAYKWIHRDGGAAALADRSHAAHTQPHQTPPEVEAALVDCRKAHPTWGPMKLLAYLARREPGLALLAPSTAGAILKRHGLVEPRRRRRRPKHPRRVPLVTKVPCDVWCADFKGQFLLGGGA